MAAAWRWLSSLALGFVTYYTAWYLACPSQVADTLPPSCNAAVGWEVPCGWSGWVDVLVVLLGGAVAVVAFMAMRPRAEAQASTP